jgi:glycosyltransferase involved in cell wall biosynthesis
MKSLKILISAYACRPNMGSEPGIGWNTVIELAKYYQVWVLTREDNRSSIEAELTLNPVDTINFIYCEPPFWARWWKPAQLPHYYFWQLGAYYVARQLHREIGFDLVHHVTYLRYSTPSFLSLLPIPFIWGPVGGGESAPPAFWQDFGFRGQTYEILRSITHRLGEIDPFTRITVERSVLVQATTSETAKRLHQMKAANVQVLSPIGLSPKEIDRLAQCPAPDSSPLRLISIARLLHWKGFHLGIQAFAMADLPDDAEYWILGEGPERQRLQTLAEKLNVANQLKFWGSLPRDETLSRLGECQIFIHPSLHDSGAVVCLEAMAAGRPVVCLDLGGPSIHVTEEAGFKIPANTTEQAITDMADAITQLAKDTQLRIRMGTAGQKQVREHFSWEVKGRQLGQLYNKILLSS